MTDHPLVALTADWLPKSDFAVLSHGFAVHGRDYEVMIQDGVGARPGTHRLIFTHAVRADCRTAVKAADWTGSWDDVFLDWERSKDMDGYVWGTNWSLAYPGIMALVDDDEAAEWEKRTGRPMFAILLKTDRFHLRLIFHAIRSEMVSDDASLIKQVIPSLAAG